MNRMDVIHCLLDIEVPGTPAEACVIHDNGTPMYYYVSHDVLYELVDDMNIGHKRIKPNHISL